MMLADSFAGQGHPPPPGATTNRGQGETMVSQGIAAVSSAARAGTVVEVRQSRYSRTQMEKASAQIWAAANRLRSGGIEVYSIVLPSDGRGLEVRTNDPVRAATLARTATTAAGDAVAATDISYRRGEPIRPVSREDPSAPYPGGIPIRWGWYVSGYDCTAAFGVRNGSGTKYLLTAEHCYDLNDSVEAMNGNNLGSVKSENNANDAALIETNSQAKVWVNDDYLRNVRSAQYSWDGEYVCQSGYTSYPNRCQIQVTNAYMQWDFQDGKGVRRGVEGHRCAGCSAVAHGDSGGPVWSTRPDGDVAARGIVSGGHTPVTPNVSYEYIVFTEVPAATAALGVSLQTS